MANFVQQESSRCLHCKNAQCSTRCPLHNNIPQFLSLVKAGQPAAAVQSIGHLFGEVCGYICPHENQCKGGCVLNARGVPVDVGIVERQVFAENFPQLQRQDNMLAHVKVAVVGGGVSGVTFAEQCYRHGADVTIFEKNQLLHTLRSIPVFRLPKEAVDRIVQAVSKIPVVQKQVDSNFVATLQRQFDVVYIATGVSVANKMYAEGEYLATNADDFLRGNTFGKTVVVGGGNTAMDCARLNVRNGYETVVAYRRSRSDMPAFNKEVELAQQENVQFCFNLAPVSVQQRNGSLVATFAKTISEGRGKLTVTDQLVEIPCDIVVSATGSKFDKSVFATERCLVVDENNHLCGNIFAGGDATGKSLAVEAVADGINAAKFVLVRFSQKGE